MNVKLGKKIGSGEYKNVYHVDESDKLCVSVSKKKMYNGVSEKNVHCLLQLKRLGFPTVEVIDQGFVDGKHAVLMKRYAFCDRDNDVVKRKQYVYVNDNSVRCMKTIYDLLVENMIVIDDFQFLYDFDGNVVISDPMDVIFDTNEFGFHERVEMMEDVANEYAFSRSCVVNSLLPYREIVELSKRYVPKVDARLVSFK